MYNSHNNMVAARNPAHSRPRIDLRVIVYQERGIWLSHCLELDIVGEGETPQESLKTLVELCTLQVETAVEAGDLQSIFRAAPAEYWKLYLQGRDQVPPTAKRPIERFEVREAALAS